MHNNHELFALIYKAHMRVDGLVYIKCLCAAPRTACMPTEHSRGKYLDRSRSNDAMDRRQEEIRCMRLSLSPKILIHVPDASFSRIYGRHYFASLLYALAASCIYIFLAFQKKNLPVISKTEKTNESFLVFGLHILCDEKASREYSWLAVTGWFRGPV
jgi:hypothetical protein